MKRLLPILLLFFIAPGLLVFVLFIGVGGKAVEDLGGVGGIDCAPPEYEKLVIEAGGICPLITPAIIAGQIKAESNWNPDAKSPVGATGISQFMPDTWAGHGRKRGSKTEKGDINDPQDQIWSQGLYMCFLADGVKGLLDSGKITGDHLDLTMASYNAGLGNVSTYHGIPPFVETQAYVKRIRENAKSCKVKSGTVSASGSGSAIVEHAEKWKGTPYSWGGGTLEGPGFGNGQGAGVNGFDCSGLSRYAVYQGTGIEVNRTADAQLNGDAGNLLFRDLPPGQGSISEAESILKAGDLVFMASCSGCSAYHVTIYKGGGMLIHAPQPGDVVKDSELAGWSGDYLSARRYVSEKKE